MKKWTCSCGQRNNKDDESCRKCRKDRPRRGKQPRQDGHAEEIKMQQTEGMDPTE